MSYPIILIPRKDTGGERWVLNLGINQGKSEKLGGLFSLFSRFSPLFTVSPLCSSLNPGHIQGETPFLVKTVRNRRK